MSAFAERNPSEYAQYMSLLRLGSWHALHRLLTASATLGVFKREVWNTTDLALGLCGFPEPSLDISGDFVRISAEAGRMNFQGSEDVTLQV